jgi:hypothetical protein
MLGKMKRGLTMNNRQRLKLLWEGLTPEERRLTAYHEAGHAAVLWMFGTRSDFVGSGVSSTSSIAGLAAREDD